jgi:PAS domain S-box-containing protein
MCNNTPNDWHNGAMSGFDHRRRRTERAPQARPRRAPADDLAQRLRLAEERLRDFAAATDDWVWETDTQHRFTFVASHHPDRFDPARVLGRTRWEMAGADPHAEPWRSHIAALEAQRPFVDFEYEARDIGGGTRFIKATGRPFFNDGVFGGYRGAATNVTERHRLSEEVLRQEERFAYLFEVHPEPMAVFDRQSFEIVAVNEAACRQYGYSREEFLSITALALLPEDERARVVRHVGASRHEDRMVGEVRHRTRDGRIIDAQIRAVSLDIDGRALRLLTATDITERKRVAQRAAMAEAQLRQSQKLDALGQLTGGIAHDFNNALAVVLASLESILERKPSDGEIVESAELALQATDQAAALTRRLLAFARRQELTPQRLDVGETVLRLRKVLASSLPLDVELAVRAEPGQAYCIVDATQLDTAVMNLVVNARDAIAAHGRIEIEVARTTITALDAQSRSELQPGDWAVVRVSDDGHGMSEDVRTKIFEPFFTTKEVGKGTGLGLSQIHGFVVQSGGFCVVDSQPGTGTSLSMHFPSTD